MTSDGRPRRITYDLANNGTVVLSTPRPRAQVGGLCRFSNWNCAADGTSAAKWSKRELRYVAVFEQLSGESRLTLFYIWPAGIKTQWPVERLIRGRECRGGCACLRVWLQANCAGPRCGLPQSSRAKPAPAWPRLNADMRHARGPELWRSETAARAGPTFDAAAIGRACLLGKSLAQVLVPRANSTLADAFGVWSWETPGARSPQQDG
jgi:hypothetical protein